MIPGQSPAFNDVSMELPPKAMAGTVFQSDGKTPAFGAFAVLKVPKEFQSTASAISDAAG